MLKQKAEEQHRNHVNNIRALRKARQTQGGDDGSVADSEATPFSSPQKHGNHGSPLKKRTYQTPRNEFSSPSKPSLNEDGSESVNDVENSSVYEENSIESITSSQKPVENSNPDIQVIGQSSKKAQRSPRGSPRAAKTKSDDSTADGTLSPTKAKSPRSTKGSPTNSKKKSMKKSLDMSDDDDENKAEQPFTFTLKNNDVASLCPDDWMHRLLASSMSIDDLHGEAPLLD